MELVNGIITIYCINDLTSCSFFMLPGDQFDDDNSNVVNFASLLAKGEKDQQLVYYQVSPSAYQYCGSFRLAELCACSPG